MFLGSWFFDYNQDDNCINFGDRIKVGWRVVNFEMLEKFHGINIECRVIYDQKEFLDAVCSNLKRGMPVIININVFQCPWCYAYKKYSIPEHYCMIVGYDDNTQMMWCIDPIFAEGKMTISLDNIWEGHATCFMFILCDANRCIDEKSLVQIAIEDMNEPEGHAGRVNRIRLFAKQLGEKLDTDIEKQGYSGEYDVPFFRYLKIIGDGRINFSKLLALLGEKLRDHDLSECSNKMLQVGELWYRQRLNIIKASMLPKQYQKIEKISGKILEIADIEYEIASELNSKFVL